MKAEEIKKLLEKYYNAETTPDEESILKNFFSTGPVPDDLVAERDIFNYYVGAAPIPEPGAGFEERIISSVAEAARETRPLKRRTLNLISGIAAGLLILTASYFFFRGRSGPRDTYSDPAIAYAETMKILYSISSQLNDGTGTLRPVGKLSSYTGRSINALALPSAILREEMKPVDRLGMTIKIFNAINTKDTNIKKD